MGIFIKVILIQLVSAVSMASDLCPATLRQVDVTSSENDIQTYLHLVKQLADRGALSSENISDLIDSNLRKNPAVLPEAKLMPSEKHVLEGVFAKLLGGRESWDERETKKITKDLWELTSEKRKKEVKKSKAKEDTRFIWNTITVKRNFLPPELSRLGVKEAEFRPKSGGHYAAYLPIDGGVAVADLETGRGKIIGKASSFSGGFFETKDGVSLVSINTDGAFKVIDLRTWAEVASIPLEKMMTADFNGTDRLYFERANPQIFERGDGSLGLILTWRNNTTGQLMAVVDLAGEFIRNPAPSTYLGKVAYPAGDGRLYEVTSWTNGSPLVVSDLLEGRIIFEVPVPPDIGTMIASKCEFTQTPSGRRYISVRGNDLMYIYDVDGKDPKNPFRFELKSNPHDPYNNFYAVSKSRTVFISANDHSIDMIDLGTMSAKNLITNTDGLVVHQTFFVNRKGRPIVAAVHDKTAIIIDIDHPTLAKKIDLSSFEFGFSTIHERDGALEMLVGTGHSQDLVQIYGPVPNGEVGK